MDAIDSYGELLFGRRLRLRVLLWAHAQTDPFNQSAAAKGVDYSSSGEVAKELERLVQLGMLRKFGRTHRVGPQNYVRIDHAGWFIAAAAQSAVEQDSRDLDGDESEETDFGPTSGLGVRGAVSHRGVVDLRSGKGFET